MNDPQNEESILAEILQCQINCNSQVTSISKTYPQAMIAHAHNKAQDSKNFLVEIQADFSEFESKIKHKLEAQAKNTGNYNFLLTSDLSEYLKCFDASRIDKIKLISLLSSDKERWLQELKRRKERKGKLVDELQATLKNNLDKL